jgi:hypothetical protein
MVALPEAGIADGAVYGSGVPLGQPETDVVTFAATGA